MNGNSKKGSPGLVQIVHAYLDMLECGSTTRAKVNAYLGLIAARASGKLQPAATWLRNFVSAHAEYKRDSRLSEPIVSDLLRACDGIAEGTIAVPELLGQYANVRREKLQDRDGKIVSVDSAKLVVDLARSGTAQTPRLSAKISDEGVDQINI